MKAEPSALAPTTPLPKGPNCWECRYLAITWDVRMPYGCKLMGFRSKVVPSLEVLRTDGRFCGGFSPKPAKPQAQKVSKKPVGNSSERQKTDPRRRIYHINLIT
jgi:hypothetical protein